jgi:type IV pilus assembly protein PilM
MPIPKNTDSKEDKELEKAFSLAVQLFKQGDFELARQKFESILRSLVEEERKGFLSRFFRKPSLRVKAEGYVKKIIQRQIQVEEEKRKKEETQRQKDTLPEQLAKEQEQTKTEESREKEEAKREQTEDKKRQEEERQGKQKAEEQRRKEEEKQTKVKEKWAMEEEKRKIEEGRREKKQKEEERKGEEKPLQPSRFARIAKKAKAMLKHPLMVGIDISDHSIELLQLDMEGNIVVCARSVLEKGIVELAEIKDAERLGEVFRETLKKAGLDVLMAKKRARIKGLFSLPESKAFIREFVFETRENLQERLKERIKETIPITFEHLYWDYIEIGNQLKEARLLMVAVPRKVIDEYLRFFWAQGVDPVVFDIEAASIARALLSPQEHKSGTAIIDMGAKTSIISIFNPKKDLNLSVSVFRAGNYFTQKIAEKLGISEQEAKQMKEELGFVKEPVSSVLKECSAVLFKEIQDALKYYQDKFGFQTERIILTGGSALLPGIEEYFQKNFKEKVEIGKPLQNINSASFFPDDKQAMLFANVIGLAMRGLDQDFIDAGINLLTDDIKREEKVLQRERERFFLYVAVYFLAIAIALSVVAFTFQRLGLIKLII